MIDLRITSKYPTEALRWQSQLKEWCAAHTTTIDNSLSEPEIHEGKKIIKGVNAINQFLKEYRAFMDDWYDCRCDKWTEK